MWPTYKTLCNLCNKFFYFLTTSTDSLLNTGILKIQIPNTTTVSLFDVVLLRGSHYEQVLLFLYQTQ